MVFFAVNSVNVGFGIDTISTYPAINIEAREIKLHKMDVSDSRTGIWDAAFPPLVTTDTSGSRKSHRAGILEGNYPFLKHSECPALCNCFSTHPDPIAYFKFTIYKSC